MIYFITLLLYICEIQTNAVKLASNFEQDHHYLGYKDKLTVKGSRCIFPFSYRGVKYNDCAPGVSKDQPSPWCAISTKNNHANTVNRWDICVSDESRLTVKGTRCIFPFVYRGVTFTSCAPGVSQPSPWCATILQDNREPKDWDVCVPDTRKDDKICKSLTKDNCKSKSIIELCPQMCSEESDADFCKLLDEDECRKNSIKNLCPNFCLEEIDEEFCLLLDKGQCRKESINKQCPQFCSKEIDEEFCILLDKDQCRKESINKRCFQFCSIAECNPRCINGFCNDNSRCTCYDGYKGAACDGLMYPCPESEGFFKLPGSDQCYKAYVDQTSTWNEADGKCKTEGLALAEPNNPLQLRKYLIEKYGNKWYWLGGVGTGFSVEFQRGGGHLYPDDALWLSWHPINPGYTSSACLIMNAKDYSLRDHPSTPYRTQRCSDTHSSHYALCEMVFE